jgi:hypothetical protein
MELVERDGRLVCGECGGRRLEFDPADEHLVRVFGASGVAQEHRPGCPAAEDDVAAPNPLNLDSDK